MTAPPRKFGVGKLRSLNIPQCQCASHENIRIAFSISTFNLVFQQSPCQSLSLSMATSTRRAEALQRPPKHYQRRAHQHDNTKTINPTANTTATTTSTPANSSLNTSSVATKHAHAIATHIKTRNSQHILQQPSPPRMKRPLDPIVNNYDPSKPKRARITVEILSRPIPPNSPPKSITVKSQAHPQPQLQTQPLTNESTIAPTTQKPPLPPTQQQSSKTATAAVSSEPPLKKHKEKAINGIKHELDRLQPSVADTSSATERPGRKLRSQEATRFKSELSAYFPDYDEVIGNDPKEQRTCNLFGTTYHILFSFHCIQLLTII